MATDEEYRAAVRGVLEMAGSALYTLVVAVRNVDMEDVADVSEKRVAVKTDFGKLGDALSTLMDLEA